MSLRLTAKLAAYIPGWPAYPYSRGSSPAAAAQITTAEDKSTEDCHFYYYAKDGCQKVETSSFNRSNCEHLLINRLFDLLIRMTARTAMSRWRSEWSSSARVGPDRGRVSPSNVPSGTRMRRYLISKFVNKLLSNQLMGRPVLECFN